MLFQANLALAGVCALYKCKILVCYVCGVSPISMIIPECNIRLPRPHNLITSNHKCKLELC